jgi:hypothetical protein
MAYGIGQLGNGILSRFYNGKWAIFGALIASAVINFAMPMLPNVEAMRVFWLGNGHCPILFVVQLDPDFGEKFVRPAYARRDFCHEHHRGGGHVFGLRAFGPMCDTFYLALDVYAFFGDAGCGRHCMDALFNRVERAGGDFSPNGPKQTGEKLKTSPWLIGSIIVFGLLGLGNGLSRTG